MICTLLRARQLVLEFVVFVCLSGTVSSISGCSSARTAKSDEERERFALVIDEARTASTERAFWVSSRPDLRFHSGFSIISYDPPADPLGRAFRWMGARSNIRVHGHGGGMHKFAVYGWVDNKALRTKPFLSVYINRQFLGTTASIDGLFEFKTTVDSSFIAPDSWQNVELVLSTVAIHWADPPDLKVALVTHAEWHEQKD
jgi:hypothetical protein